MLAAQLSSGLPVLDRLRQISRNGRTVDFGLVRGRTGQGEVLEFTLIADLDTHQARRGAESLEVRVVRAGVTYDQSRVNFTVEGHGVMDIAGTRIILDLIEALPN